MGVTSEVNGGCEVDEREYPWIGVFDGTIVLFSARDTGTVIADETELDCEFKEDHGFRVGDHDTGWDMDLFEPFEGAVTLSNDDIEVLVVEEDDE